MANDDEQQLASAPSASSPAKVARPTGIALDAARLAVGERIEVLWEVEMSDGADERVWWGAVIKAAEDDDNAESSSAAGEVRLEYEAQHGFGTEERRVLVLEGSYVWDRVLGERLPFRKEGEEGPPLAEAEEGEESAGIKEEGAEDDDGEEQAEADDEDGDEGPPPEGALPVGTAVKARFQGGERAYAGTIHKARADGTYDVLYDADQVLEEGVPLDVIQVVEMSASVRAALSAGGDGSTIAANSEDELFSTFVGALTGGAMFAKLTPEQQAVASDKVRAMRPHFQAELAAFKEERGWGATVTGEDIKVILPRIIARSRAAA